MSFFTKLNELSDEILNHLFNAKKDYLYNYSCLETGISDERGNMRDMPIFATQTGGLLTVLQIDGLKTIISGQTYADSIINHLAQALSSNFKKQGHYFQMCFQFDPSKSKENIDAILADKYLANEKLHLDLNYIVDDEKDALYRSGMGAEEKNYLLLWTLPSLFSPSEQEMEANGRVEEFKNANLPLGGSANPFAAYKGLINKHKAYVENILRELGNVQLDFQVLDLAQAAREMRSGIERGGVSNDWRVRLPGDYYVPMKTHENLESEGWNVVPDTVAQQVFKQDMESVNKKIVRCGQYFFAPVYMTDYPQEVQFFRDLFDKLTSYRDMGWRVMFSIGGDGVDAKKLQRSISAILAFASERNRLFNDTVDSMGDYVNKAGETAVTFRFSACTWGKTLDQAETNVSQLIQSIESWGSPNVSDVTGNPIEGVASASIGFTPYGIAPEAAPPLRQAVQMLPLSRPARIWSKGSLIFGTTDGKLMPYQPMSSLQSSWTTLFTGIPGYGKSVSMNDSHLSFVMNSLNDELPYIAIIDVDRSSEGFVRLIRDALPEDEKYKAQYIRLSNSPKYCINLNDTMPGCRFLLESQRAYVLGFLTTSMADPMTGQVPDGMAQFLSDLVDRTFQRLSDCFITYPHARPRTFQANSIQSVTNSLREIGFEPVSEEQLAHNLIRNEGDSTRATSWWEVADILFAHPSGKYKREALLAQQRAVPVLTDYIITAREDLHIKSMYGDKEIGKENFINVFCRTLQSVITSYPIVSDHTKFEIGDVRILALDLMEVATGHTMLEAKQAALMYMFATNAMANSFMLDTKQVASVPAPDNVRFNDYTDVALYKKAFLEKVGGIANAYKRFTMDEMSVPMKIPSMKDYVNAVALLMRKRKTEFMGASQLFTHFPHDLLTVQTTLNILSPCTDADIQILKDKAGVSEPGEIYALQKMITPPSADGSVFVAIYKTKRANGRYAVLLRNKIGAIKLWSLTTTQEDYRLFCTMEKILGNAIAARKILAKAYPGGSAKADIERIMRETDTRKNIDVFEELCHKWIKIHGQSVMG